MPRARFLRSPIATFPASIRALEIGRLAQLTIRVGCLGSMQRSHWLSASQQRSQTSIELLHRKTLVAAKAWVSLYPNRGGNMPYKKIESGGVPPLLI